MDIHASKSKQPLGDLQLAVPTSQPKRYVITGMNIYAAQPKQSLGLFQVPMFAGVLKG
jgi:hypothetical protein